MQTRLIVLSLLGLCLFAWVKFRAPGLVLPSPAWLIVAGLVAGVAVGVPGVRRRLDVALQRLRHPSWRLVWGVTSGVGVLGFALVIFSAWMDGRTLHAFWHDELSTVLQARMLLAGRLWMPAHAQADFFETFHVIVKPVYASMYFPGGALALWPALVLHLPTAVWTAVLAGVYAGVTYRVLARLTDGMWGLVGAVMLVSLQIFRANGSLFTGHLPSALLCMTGVWAWLRWRDKPALRWAILAGVVLGWACITRPADAASYLLPLGVGLILDLRHLPRAVVLKTLLVGLLASAPFAAVQLVFNRGVTGQWLTFPQDFQMRDDAPLPVIPEGVVVDPKNPSPDWVPEIKSELVQKQILYHTFLLPLAWEYLTDSTGSYLDRRLVIAPVSTLPHPYFLMLLPLGMYALWRGRDDGPDPKKARRLTVARGVMVAVVPTFLLVYAAWPWFLKHYLLPPSPGMILIVLLGAKCLSDRASLSGRQNLSMFIPLLLTLMCVTIWPGLGATSKDQGFVDKNLRTTEKAMYDAVQAPAVVFFRFDPSSPYNLEPVYNTDTAWPDDAPIIRAHDLGARSLDLVRYYADLQPDRRIYKLNRADNEVQYLGTAREVAERER